MFTVKTFKLIKYFDFSPQGRLNSYIYITDTDNDMNKNI